MEKYRTANELYEICQTKEAMLNASFERALKENEMGSRIRSISLYHNGQ